jgi:hypothetical protein
MRERKKRRRGEKEEKGEEKIFTKTHYNQLSKVKDKENFESIKAKTNIQIYAICKYKEPL